jgi:hypothetical protein
MHFEHDLKILEFGKFYMQNIFLVIVNDELNEVASRAFESILTYVKRNPDLGLTLGRIDNITVNATDPQFLLDTRKFLCCL